MPDIAELLETRKIVFYDGAMGTMLQRYGLKPGEKPELMNINAPGAVENIHKMYIEAGSDIICANTFGANAYNLRRTEHSPEQIITAAIGAAKRAAGATDRLVLTALDIGPIGQMLEPSGELSFIEAYKMFKQMAAAGEKAGADIAAIETMSDIEELKAAVMAVLENTKLPVFATMTFEKSGYTYMGCTPERFTEMAEQFGVSAVGLNCSLEPKEMAGVTERIAGVTKLPLIVKPNAGLPDKNGEYHVDPQEFTAQMLPLVNLGARIIGGCCGTTPEHIRVLVDKLHPERKPGNTKINHHLPYKGHIMINEIFTPTDILVPADTSQESLEKWSVIACDQFSSELNYWERVRGFVGNAPSTLEMIIPEAYLGQTNENEQIKKISAAMERNLSSGVLRELQDSFIYTERTLSDGSIRRGIIGAVDLEQYDFTGKSAAIRASEGTVLERLPVRKSIRAAASLELPHVIVFIDDKEKTVIEPLAQMKNVLPKVYGFELMEGGGQITGWQVSGADAAHGAVMQALNNLQNADTPAMIVGDGNHSLAGAKVYWDELKKSLDEAQRETHPARRALVEVCNVYDTAIKFEAIHRVLFGVEATAFVNAIEQKIPQGNDYIVQWVSKDSSGRIGIKACCIGDMLGMVQELIDDYIKQNKDSSVDYIHGEDSVRTLAQGDRCLGLILPAMDKSDLFKTVATSGVFPRKSFSVGHAKDKRYYLECRKLSTPD